MEQSGYERYAVAVDTILKEFLLHLKHTFGRNVEYVGTTTGPDTRISDIRDIDTIVVLSGINEGYITYLWKIINALHAKYNILLDTRTYAPADLDTIPVVNKYLLKLFLNDLQGLNPFREFEVPRDALFKECVERIREQERAIIASIPRIPSNPDQIRAIAQSVFDAIRAYLVIVGHPLASKEDSAFYMSEKMPLFPEVSWIYDGYLNPDAIIDVGPYIVDSLALVKHLLYKTLDLPISDSVLLVNTPSSTMPHPRDDYLSYDQNMPLGIVCITSYLKENRIPVRVLDAYAENLGALSTVDRIFQVEELPKIIGFNCASPNVHVVHKIASYVRRIRDDLVLVCGGPHASLATKHTLSTESIDYVVSGEGEIPFLRLVKSIRDGNIPVEDEIPGVYSLVSDRIVGRDNADFLDLSTIPEPDFSVLPLDRYFAVKKRLYVHTSRGCAFNCIFCSVPQCWGQSVREIPIQRLADHVQSLFSRYAPDEFQVVDDNFSHKNGKLIRAFCQEIIDREMNLRWKCQARADQLDDSLVAAMAVAGCFEVDLGVESGNREIQKYIRKNLNLAATKDVVRSLKSHGIYCKAFFMIGFPEETYEQIADTINYAIELKENGLGDIAVFPVMPFPGTEIARRTGSTVFQGAIIDHTELGDQSFASHRLRKYSAKPEVSLNNLFSPDELRLLVKMAYLRFELGARVRNLKDEFDKFAIMEESNTYGL